MKGFELQVWTGYLCNKVLASTKQMVYLLVCCQLLLQGIGTVYSSIHYFLFLREHGHGFHGQSTHLLFHISYALDDGHVIHTANFWYWRLPGMSRMASHYCVHTVIWSRIEGGICEPLWHVLCQADHSDDAHHKAHQPIEDLIG